jgi:hypothetical protein
MIGHKCHQFNSIGAGPTRKPLYRKKTMGSGHLMKAPGDSGQYRVLDNKATTSPVRFMRREMYTSANLAR